LGIWLSGKSQNIGAETEWYYSRNVLGDLPAEPNELMTPWLLGLVCGATVYNMENMRYGMVDIPGTEWERESGPPCWYPKAKKWGKCWTQSMLPFIEDVIRFRLIPSKEEVAKRCKAAIVDRRKDYFQWTKDYRMDRLYPLVNALYGVKHKHEVVPNESKYFIVPILPYWVEEKAKEGFKLVVSLDDVDTHEEARKFKEVLDKLYPVPEDFGGEAFVGKVGELAVVLNTEERRKEAREESFWVKFPRGPVMRVEGKVGFSQYLIMKVLDDGRFFVHANNYEDRKTRLEFTLRVEAQLEVEPKEALLREERRGEKLLVEVSHRQGVVRIFVKPKS